MVPQVGISKAAAGALIVAGLTATTGAVVVASPQLRTAATTTIQTIWPNRQVQYVHTRNAAHQLLRAEYAYWHKQLELLRKDAHSSGQRELIRGQLGRFEAAKDDYMVQLGMALTSCFGNQAARYEAKGIETPTAEASPSRVKAATARASDVGMPSSWAELAAGDKRCPAARTVVDAAWAKFKSIWSEAAAAAPKSR